MILSAQSVSGLCHFLVVCLFFCQISSFALAAAVLAPLNPSFTPLLSSASLGGHLGRDKASICESTGSLHCRQVMIQTHSQAHSCTSTHTHASERSSCVHIHVPVQTCTQCDPLFLYVSNRSRKRVRQMLKKHRRDAGQRALAAFTAKIKGWRV